ncbi:MAG: LCP family protein [Lawsonibacter sp.]|nr:LCP family protein [Lawsonibacter sp.]
MEERFINLSHQSGGHREASHRGAPSPKRPKRGRSAAVAVLMGFYKVLVVVSVIIVAGYVGFSIMVKAPEQAGTTPPSQAGSKLGSDGGGADAADPNTGTNSGLTPRKGVYNILLAATDAEGYRTDIMMVMCYDTVEQTVGVVSVPRDTLVARDTGNPHLVYGKGGVEQRVKDIANMLGVPIDYYIQVNIQGFITLVDYLDGVDFYIPCSMDYDDPTPGQNLHIHYQEGMRHLTGQQAMEVARFRKNNDGSGYSDVGRTQTQQGLLVALAKKVLSWGNITKINGFVEIFNQNVTTDLSLNDMLYFASQAINLDPSTGVETATLEGNGFGLYNGYRYCYELDPETTLNTVNRLINPYNRDLTLADMNLAKADSYHN